MLCVDTHFNLYKYIYIYMYLLGVYNIENGGIRFGQRQPRCNIATDSGHTDSEHYASQTG